MGLLLFPVDKICAARKQAVAVNFILLHTQKLNLLCAAQYLSYYLVAS